MRWKFSCLDVVASDIAIAITQIDNQLSPPWSSAAGMVGYVGIVLCLCCLIKDLTNPVYMVANRRAYLFLVVEQVYPV